MIFNMKIFFLLLFLSSVAIGQEAIDKGVSFRSFSPMLSLGLGALVFGGYAYGSGREAYNAYTYSKSCDNFPKTNLSCYNKLSHHEIYQKASEAVVCAGIALVCLKFLYSYCQLPQKV